MTGDDEKRSNFLTACLLKLGLQVNEDDKTVPSLSRLHLSTNSPPDLAGFMRSLREVITIHDGEEYLKDENDTFHFEKPSAWAFNTMKNALPAVTGASTDEDSPEDDRDIDYNAIVKRVIVHEKELPVGKETPYFIHDVFFSNLYHYASQAGEKEILFGKILFYGDVVTSTNTMLEKYKAPRVQNECSLIYAKESAIAPSSAHGFCGDGQCSSSRSWAWLKCLGIACWVTDVFCRHPTLT